MWCTVYTSLSPMNTRMALSVKPDFFPVVRTTMGGRRLQGRSARSRLGEESRDDGLEDSERGDTGPGCRPPDTSSGTTGCEVRRAKRGMASRLWVLLITRGLVLLSEGEELEDARGRRLPTNRTEEVTGRRNPATTSTHLARCAAGLREEPAPPASARSSFSSLWLRSEEKLRLEGVARCSVLLYT
ncbi:hypothetical protein EYF80_055410 [Liparis tanakae]|uniref:Uncharacterized protein n=1 Tax=Liparis tanakae TaxID=230148 RepID=A0A4Z2EZY9_9TELE|nr:hypothetical protein EYF80_055410 [Liparis tanakae]